MAARNEVIVLVFKIRKILDNKRKTLFYCYFFCSFNPLKIRRLCFQIPATFGLKVESIPFFTNEENSVPTNFDQKIFIIYSQ